MQIRTYTRTAGLICGGVRLAGLKNSVPSGLLKNRPPSVCRSRGVLVGSDDDQVARRHLDGERGRGEVELVLAGLRLQRSDRAD